MEVYKDNKFVVDAISNSSTSNLEQLDSGAVNKLDKNELFTKEDAEKFHEKAKSKFFKDLLDLKALTKKLANFLERSVGKVDLNDIKNETKKLREKAGEKPKSTFEQLNIAKVSNASVQLQ